MKALEGRVLKVVAVDFNVETNDRGFLGEVHVEDEDGDLITFDVDPRGLPKTYKHSNSDI